MPGDEVCRVEHQGDYEVCDGDDVDNNGDDVCLVDHVGDYEVCDGHVDVDVANQYSATAW